MPAISQEVLRRYAKPTRAQAEAGNYRMGHVRLHGLDISIETPKGKRRRPEWPAMAAHYGYIKRTTGNDGDHVDVFVGPILDSQVVVVVDQVNQDGSFDEHKALLGFRNSTEAIECYKKCYTKGWKVGKVTIMTIPQFKNWLKDGSQSKPIADQVCKYSAGETVTGKHGDKGRYVTTDDGNQIFITESGEINRTGKPIGGSDSLDTSATPPNRNRPESIPKKTMQHPGGGVGIDLEGRLPSQQQSRKGTDWDQRLKQLQQRRGDSGIPDFAEPVPQPRKMWQEQKLSHPAAVNPAEESHPHHLSNLSDAFKQALLKVNMELSSIATPIQQRAFGAQRAGAEPVAVKQEEFAKVDRSQLNAALGQLKQAINDAAAQGVNLKPFVRHNDVIPRTIAAKLKPNDSMFRPVKPQERYAAMFEAAMEHYAARKMKSMPGQMGLFDDDFTGKFIRKPNQEQTSFDWDESKVKRDDIGRFATQSGNSRPKGSPERKLLGKRAGDAKVIGAMLYDQIESKKPASLLGHTVSSSEDLASLAQVYRDPRFETMRAFFVKDGKIIGQNAYSSRLPGMVVFSKDMPNEIKADLEELGADGFYLLHNHPTGDPRPSPEDINATKWIDSFMPGKLLSHVIINHTAGTIISPKGKTREYSIENEALQDTSQATLPHEFLDYHITSTEAFGKLALQNRPEDGRAIVVLTNAKYNVRAILDVSIDSLKTDSHKMLGAIRRATRLAGAGGMRFLVLPEGVDSYKFKKLTEEGLFGDIVSVGDKTLRSKRTLKGGEDPIAKRATTNALSKRAIMRERMSVYRDALVEKYMATLDQYAAKKGPKNSPGQLGLLNDGKPLRSSKTQQKFRWITVHPNGPDTKGVPVMIDDEGTVQGGMGGKFTGQKIGDLGKDKGKPDLEKHRKNLLKMAADYDRKQIGTTITDVTPEGFGPAEGESQPDKHLTTEQQRLRRSILEAESLLRGKTKGDKRKAIELSLRSSQIAFEELENENLKASNRNLAKDGFEPQRLEEWKTGDRPKKAGQKTPSSSKTAANEENAEARGQLAAAGAIKLERIGHITKAEQAKQQAKNHWAGTLSDRDRRRFDGPDDYADAVAKQWENRQNSGNSQASDDKTKPEPKSEESSNPFRDQAEAIKRRAESLSPGGSARDKAMASAFPVGTGNPGNAASRRNNKSAWKRIDKSIDDAKRALKLFDAAKQMEARAEQFDKGLIDKHGNPTDKGIEASRKVAQQRVERAELKKTADEHLADYMRETLKPGEQVFLAGSSNSVTVKRVNAKSISTDMGSKWRYDELRPANAEGKAMSTKEMADLVKSRMESSKPQVQEPAGIEVPVLKNEEAKSGDQLGLFGERKAAPRKQTDFSGGKGKAKQANLIDGLGAAEGQMSLIDEAGAPEDMVYNPKKKDLFAALKQAYIQRYTATLDRSLDRYRAGANNNAPKAKSNKSEVTTGSFGDRGRFVTLDSGQVIFIKTDGSVGRGPRELKGKRVDASKGKERKRNPKTTRADKFAPKSKLDLAIVDAVGDHPDDVEAFKGFVNDAHKMIDTERREQLDDMRQLLGHFGLKGKAAAGWLSSLKRMRDYSKIPAFDEMVDHARKYMPAILAGETGESDKGGDDESRLFSRLQEGFPAPPAKHDADVIALAQEMAGTQFMDDHDDYKPRTVGKQVLENPDDPFSDFVPFAASFGDQVLDRYHALLT